MKTPAPRRGFDWEAAGRTLSASLAAHHAVVVIGMDPVATGRVAIGIGRRQAYRRRVAVGDLFAESPPIQELIHTDDPHGLVDSFLYGVSLSRIAYEVPDAGQLFVMPSGTEPPDYDEILINPRWHRLVAGFREVGALLVLAAPANAPHIEDLVAATDGAVLVGDAVPRKLPVSRIIASLREPVDEPLAKMPVPPKAPIAEVPVPALAAAKRRWSRRRLAAAAGVVITLGLAGAGAWLAYRPLAKSPPPMPRVKPDTTKGLGAVLPVTDTAARPSGDSGAVIAMPGIANAADSTVAAAFAVELMAANTQAGAILQLQKDTKILPAATFAPVLIQGARWYKVLGGAYSTRAGADSLLLDLRRRHVLADSSGSVVRLPLAFLIDSVVVAAVPGVLASYADQGLPVYALRQANGFAWLLAGAFESVEQSSLYGETLRATGAKAPPLVYRKGRMF